MPNSLPLSTLLASQMMIAAYHAQREGETFDPKTEELLAHAERIIMDDKVLEAMLVRP